MEIFLAEVDHLLAKEVAVPAGPAAAQVKSSAGCSVTDRESPWVTLLTGTWRAWAGPLAGEGLGGSGLIDLSQPVRGLGAGVRVKRVVRDDAA